MIAATAFEMSCIPKVVSSRFNGHRHGVLSARGFDIACSPIRESRSEGSALPGRTQEACWIAGSQVEDHGIGGLGGTGTWPAAHGFDRRKVLRPNQRIQIVDQQDRHPLSVFWGLRCFHPGRTVKKDNASRKRNPLPPFRDSAQGHALSFK